MPGDTVVNEQELIKLENVHYTYAQGQKNEVEALVNCNLTIKPGEFLAIIGGNGSGKSTLAKLLNGLNVPTKGRVLVDGMDTSREENIWKIRKRVGMVFQNPDNQLVASTLEEDIAFGLENIALPSKEIVRRVNQYIELLNLTAVRQHPPHMLSGGQKQRLAIAGVLAMEPDCLVLDEPTAMLDPRGRQDLIQRIIDLNTNQQITVVLITHLMEEVVFSHRVVLLDQGRMVMENTPRELFSRAEEVKKYGLELPGVLELAEKLRAAGLNINKTPLGIDELVDTLCGQ